MNLILFEPEELGQPLAAADKRYKHLLKVLKVQKGSTFDMGQAGGRQGKATVQEITPNFLRYSFRLTIEPAPLHPVTLVLAFIRPVNGQRTLREMSTLGVSNIRMVITDKTEKSYADSHYYRQGNIRQLLKEGAEQAFTSRLPLY